MSKMRVCMRAKARGSSQAHAHTILSARNLDGHFPGIGLGSPAHPNMALHLPATLHPEARMAFDHTQTGRRSTSALASARLVLSTRHCCFHQRPQWPLRAQAPALPVFWRRMPHLYDLRIRRRRVERCTYGCGAGRHTGGPHRHEPWNAGHRLQGDEPKAVWILSTQQPKAPPPERKRERCSDGKGQPLRAPFAGCLAAREGERLFAHGPGFWALGRQGGGKGWERRPPPPVP